MPKVAPKGTKYRPSSAALPAAVPHRPCRRAPPHPPPPQHPARHRMAAASSAVAPQSRRRATLRATVWPQLVPPSPLRAGAERPTPRCGAAPARALPVYARAPCARTVWTAPKHALRAGGRVELPPPPPPARGAAAPSSLVVRLYTSHCWSLEAPQSFLPVT